MNLDILRMLEDLRQLVEKPKKFGPITFGFDPDEMVIQIEKVRAGLPKDIKQAANLTRESERIVEGAREDAHQTLESARREVERLLNESKTEAARILEHARLQQEQMVAESEILKLSKAQADEIRSTAEREATQLRRGAENYVHDMLIQLESVLGRALTTIERGKSEISISGNQRSELHPAVATREKVRA